MKQILQSTFLLAICILLITACKKDEMPEDNPSPNPVPPIAGPPIRFDSLAVGQVSSYIGLNGEQYVSSTESFVYTDDTLHLKIVSQDANGFLVEETLRYVGDVDPWLATDKDKVYKYYLKVENDTLRFKSADGSFFFCRLFGYQIGLQGLPLASFNNQEIDLTGWRTSLSYCECRRTGYTEQYTMFGQTFPRLNVLIENSPMAFDGNGETYAYSNTHGIVRSSTYSWWTQSGIGWDLLP